MAVSLDGRIASHPGETDAARAGLGFTNEDDRRHLLSLLATADAVVVGRSSLSASGGAFAQRNDRGAFPVWAVLTNAGLPADARFFTQTELPRWLVSAAPLALPPAAAGVRNVVAGPGQSTARAAVTALQAAGARRVLLFGGSEVNRQFYAEGLVDRLILTVCPLILGAAAALPLVAPELPRPVSLTLDGCRPQGSLVFLEYRVRGAVGHSQM